MSLKLELPANWVQYSSTGVEKRDAGNVLLKEMHSKCVGIQHCSGHMWFDNMSGDE